MWYKETDGIGRPSAPLELKTLGVRRVLGRGICFDGIAELTNFSEEITRVFLTLKPPAILKVFNPVKGLVEANIFVLEFTLYW